MTQEHLTPYIDKWCNLAQYLNDYIVQNGPLKPNIHPIWNKYLHEYNDNDWIGIIACCMLIDEERPDVFDIGQTSHIDRLKQLYEDPLQEHKLERRRAKEKRRVTQSILDLPENKGSLWKLAMILRESYCTICNLKIKNK